MARWSPCLRVCDLLQRTVDVLKILKAGDDTRAARTRVQEETWGGRSCMMVT